LAVGCSGGAVEYGVELQLGDANPGLSAERLAAFERGQAVFERRFKLSDGHGPDFNTSSCSACHEFPVTGGSSPLYRNFFMARDATGQNFFEGNQLVARTFSYVRPIRESMAGATTIAQRNSPAIFGVGSFERIRDLDILVNEDPNDANGDGISGIVNRDDGRVGRFGYKAQESGIEDFLRGPLFNHMGITTNPLSFASQLAQVPTTGNPTLDNDSVSDPEMLRPDLDDLFTWVRELAGPQPLPMDSEALLGEALFLSVGCGKCHIKNLATTGEPINAYTDLLIHDMGPALADGIVMSLASGSEFRTQPLWGLRHHAPFLHDGRADTIEAAILAHGGEGQQSRDTFNGLSTASRAAVLRFLETR
jgi:CxxC motif-containing protein (DUF1111 family)